jgi:hypothetical protein
MKREQCSEKLAYKIQTAGNYPEESIQHLMYCPYFQKNGKENSRNFRDSKTLYTVGLACTVATRNGHVGVRLLVLVDDGWPLESSV